MNEILDRTPKGEKLTASNGHEIYTKIHAKVHTGERAHLGERYSEAEEGRTTERFSL